jgi:hypothetical protein
MHEDIVLRVKDRLLLDQDKTYKDTLLQTRYGRTYLPFDNNEFMLTYPYREKLLYTDMLRNSYASAKTHFSSIRETQTEHKFSTMGHELMSTLLQVSAADGAAFAQTYFSYLCGGRGLALSIDTSQHHDDDIIYPMACFATLLLIPIYMLDVVEVRSLIAGILQPFSYHTNVREAGGDVVLGNISMASSLIVLDARGNVTGIVGDDQIRAILNRNLHGTTFDKVRGHQRATAKRNAVAHLINVFKHIRNTEMTAMVGLPQLFTFADREDRVFYLPFKYDNEVPEYILFKKHLHGANDYQAAAIGLRNKLAELMKAMSYTDPAIEKGMPMFLSTYVNQQAIFRTSTSLATATLHTVLAVQDPHVTPPANAIRVGEHVADSVDIALIDIRGPLAFIMHGIESDKLAASRDTTSEAYKFIQYNFELPIPDAYGPYLYLERAIARDVYREFHNDKVMYLEQDLLVRMCMHVLSLWFDKLDTGTEARLTTMFQESATYLDHGDFIIPDELKIRYGAIQPVPRVEAVAIKPSLEELNNNIVSPYGLKVFSVDDNGGATQVYPKVSPGGTIFTEDFGETQIEVSYRRGKQQIRDFFISIRQPLKTYVFMDYNRVNTKIYMIDEEHFEECFEEDLNNPGRAIEEKKIISYEEFMQLYATHRTKEVYSAKDVREMLLTAAARNRNFRAEYVHIEKTYCNFNFQEELTDYDTYSSMPDIKVKLDEYLATDKKYVVEGSVPVYYKKCNENYLVLNADGTITPGTVLENENFLPFYGFQLQDFMALVATFGDIDIQKDVGIMFGDERKLKLMDGLGAVICSDDVVISSRDKEDIVMQSSLPLHPLMP